MNHGKQKTIINSIIHDSCFMIHTRKGFTLIELLVVVAVLGIVSGGILIALNIGGVIGKASLTKAKKFAAQLERGLVISQVGKWSFEDADASDTASDTSGYSNNGDLGGSTSCTSAIGTGTCPTKVVASDCGLGFGRCLSFDGTDDYVEYTGLADFTATSQKTISVWFKLNADGFNGAYSQPVVNAPYFRIYVRNASNEVRARTDDVAASRESPLKTLGNGNRDWHHGVGVFSWNGSTTTQTLTLYVDGTLIGSSDHTTTPSSVYEKHIGRRVTGYFNGMIDEASIYNEALTLSQIRGIYAQGVLRKEISLRF